MKQVTVLVGHTPTFGHSDIGGVWVECECGFVTAAHNYGTADRAYNAHADSRPASEWKAI